MNNNDAYDPEFARIFGEALRRAERRTRKETTGRKVVQLITNIVVSLLFLAARLLIIALAYNYSLVPMFGLQAVDFWNILALYVVIILAKSFFVSSK